MADNFHYDVFLSHSAKDKAVVRPLAERLRQDGLKVWFDEWVLKPGDSIPAKIEEGLEHSRVLVLCMSAHAFGSDWAQLEAGTFRCRDPLNQERRFIPMRLDDAPIKGSLAQVLYVDYRERANAAFEELLAGCREAATVVPPSLPTEPNGAYSGIRTHSQRQQPLKKYNTDLLEALNLWRGLGLGRTVRLDETYITHRIIQKTERQIQGPPPEGGESCEETCLDEELLTLISGTGFRGKCLCIEGPAGSGKTTLLRRWALNLAARYHEDSKEYYIPILLPLNFIGRLCRDNPDWDVPIVRLVAQQYPDASGSIDERLVDALAEGLNSGKILIMLDAVDELAKGSGATVWNWINRMRHSAKNCQVVITTRPGEFGIFMAQPDFEYFRLAGLQEEQQREFVTRWFSAGGQLIARAEAMIKQITESQALAEMARTPLFMTMMCIEFEVTGNISKSQALLFDRFIRTLLEFWDRERGVGQDYQGGQDFPLDLKLRILEAAGASFLEREQIVFRERDLVESTESLLRQLGSRAEASAMIKGIESRSGL